MFAWVGGFNLNTHLTKTFYTFVASFVYSEPPLDVVVIQRCLEHSWGLLKVIDQQKILCNRAARCHMRESSVT